DILFDAVFSCTMCKACENICPVELPLLDIWKLIRNEAFHRGKWDKKLTLIYNKLNETHNIFGRPQKERLQWAEKLDIDIKGYINKRSSLLLFIGCQASYNEDMQNIARSAVTILYKAGLDFTILGEKEWCCGSPILLAGGYEVSKSLAERNFKEFRKLKIKEIVTTCASCYNVLKNDYPKLLGDKWNIKVKHISEVIEQLLIDGKIKLKKEIREKITYKDPCELVRHCNFYEPPRKVINFIPKVRYEELSSNKEQALCCGGGGLLPITNPKLVESVNKKLIDEILYSEADIIVNSCPLCQQTIKKGLERAKKNIKVIDLVELIAQTMEVT
ncbi:MAG: (Fe-S)-binding protein, partial [Candidatus Heimdallarchaeaceae archaeon]